MEIRIESLIEGARRAEGTVVIIDVYRAFSAEAVAFARGAEKIILVPSVDLAREIKSSGKAHLSMGEVHGIRPEGFDFGNSPWELSSANVRGKTLVHSTMAGTVGVNSATKADCIYVGSLVLAQATVKALLRDNPALVTLVAMGDGGKYRTDEDEQCALYMRNLLEGRQPDREAVRSLVMAGGQSKKYDDKSQPQYHPKDRSIALEVDSSPFAVKVGREDGFLVSRPVYL